MSGIEKVFENGISTDKITGNVKFKSKRITKGDFEDVDEITITLTDDKEIQYDISAYVIIKAMLQSSDGHCNCTENSIVSIINVLYTNDFEYSADKKQLDIRFIVISNAEKVNE